MPSHKNDKKIIDEQTSDEQLMSAFSQTRTANKQKAFELLYQRHKGPLFRFMKKSINNEQDCNELFQELWFRVINHKHQFDSKQKFTTWLYTIARRLLIDQFRKMGRQAETEQYHESSEHELSVLNIKQPENEFEAKLMARELNHAINLLPFNQKQIFVMKHESNLTIKEIASIVSQPTERTKSQYRYAAQKVKLAMERLQ